LDSTLGSEERVVSKRRLQKLVSSIILPSIENHDKGSSALDCLEKIIEELHANYTPIKKITYKSYFTDFNIMRLLREGKKDLVKLFSRTKM